MMRVSYTIEGKKIKQHLFFNELKGAIRDGTDPACLQIKYAASTFEVGSPFNLTLNYKDDGANANYFEMFFVNENGNKKINFMQINKEIIFRRQ